MPARPTTASSFRKVATARGADVPVRAVALTSNGVAGRLALAVFNADRAAMRAQPDLRTPCLVAAGRRAAAGTPPIR